MLVILNQAVIFKQLVLNYRRLLNIKYTLKRVMNQLHNDFLLRVIIQHVHIKHGQLSLQGMITCRNGNTVWTCPILLIYYSFDLENLARPYKKHNKTYINNINISIEGIGTMELT